MMRDHLRNNRWSKNMHNKPKYTKSRQQTKAAKYDATSDSTQWTECITIIIATVSSNHSFCHTIDSIVHTKWCWIRLKNENEFGENGNVRKLWIRTLISIYSGQSKKFYSILLRISYLMTMQLVCHQKLTVAQRLLATKTEYDIPLKTLIGLWSCLYDVNLWKQCNK